jgi:hypothetical protein
VYQHPGYARSLEEFGTPRHLPSCDGWVLQRPIPGFAAEDAMGCYPLFSCREWSRLSRDLEDLRGELVSVVLVADPFGDYDPADLQTHFDRVSAFKKHFIVDFGQPKATTASKHHRYYARRALKEVRVEMCEDPLRFLNEWHALYGSLIDRHGLTGIKAFSRATFAKQLSLPGAIMFYAERAGEIVGAHWYFVQEEVGYSHLAAYSSAGYACGAPYALQWSAIRHFEGSVKWLDLGAGAGASSEGSDGLTRFKGGWANITRNAYLCGRILDARLYEAIIEARCIPPAPYFPLYRKGEFA